MKRLIIPLLSALILLSGCAPKRFGAVYTDVFDTFTELTVYCDTEDEFNACSAAAHAELLRLHEIFDIYNTYGGLTNAASLNSDLSADCPDELVELIASGKQWYELSDGKLNIALGSVLSLWHDCREKGVLPDESELKARAEHCAIADIVIDGNNVSLSDPLMSVDLGAVAKGYAAQKTAELLAEAGFENFALSVGGNVVTRGKKPSGRWEIGIEDPDGGLLTTVKVSGESVVTSGDYQRFFEVDGVRYHHIIDPDTLYPAGLWRSVTVISENSAEADALSTALFCLDEQSGRALAEKFSAEAMWVAADGSIAKTEGFSDYEK